VDSLIYCAVIGDGVVSITLPDGFAFTESEWKDMVARASQAEL
jgi:hypothetical protein